MRLSHPTGKIDAGGDEDDVGDDVDVAASMTEVLWIIGSARQYIVLHIFTNNQKSFEQPHMGVNWVVTDH